MAILNSIWWAVAKKCDISLAPWGEGVRRTGEGLLGNFLTLLGKNLWEGKYLFVILHQKQRQRIVIMVSDYIIKE